MAKEQNVHAAAIVLDVPEEVMQERNKARPERRFPERVIRQHCRDVKRSIKNLKREGFRFVYVINSLEQLKHTEVVRTKLWSDKKDEHGPFDIIGDIHGCCDGLELLLDKLGYAKSDGVYAHLEGRKAAFLGDFCDRGNRNADVLRLVMDMVKEGNAIAVPGNHDVKLLKHLRGKSVSISHGMDKTVAEIEAQGEIFKSEVSEFIDGLISHYILDGGKLSAYRYPEGEIIDVDALQQYYEPVKPFEETGDTDMGDMLTAGDFNRKLHIETELMPSIDIHENNAAAALGSPGQGGAYAGPSRICRADHRVRDPYRRH